MFVKHALGRGRTVKNKRGVCNSSYKNNKTKTSKNQEVNCVLKNHEAQGKCFNACKKKSVYVIEAFGLSFSMILDTLIHDKNFE